jgi:hypothetical protein
MGKYPKKVQQQRARKNMATPGAAARINERNPQPYDDVPVKATIQTRPPLSSFDPNNYLKAQQLPFTCKEDVSTNNLHASKVAHRKMDV